MDTQCIGAESRGLKKKSGDFFWNVYFNDEVTFHNNGSLNRHKSLLITSKFSLISNLISIVGISICCLHI